MDTFDELVWNICSAQDDVTHLNEKGAAFQSDTRKAIEARTATIERLRKRWDGLVKVAESYEQWEADLVIKADWTESMPCLTQPLFDALMNIQAMRNAALAAAKGK